MMTNVGIPLSEMGKSVLCVYVAGVLSLPIKYR